MLISKGKYIFTSIKFLSHEKINVEKLFLSYRHKFMYQKMFFFMKKKLKRKKNKKYFSWKITWNEKKVKIFSKDNMIWQKINYLHFNKRNKKNDSLKWIFATNQGKTGLTFCFIAIWKEVKSQSTEARIPIPLKHEVVLQWNGPWLASFPAQSSWFSD